MNDNLAPSNQIETLTRINVADMLDNFGLSGLRYGRGLIERLCRPPARAMAQQAARFDREVGEAGLQAAAHTWLLSWVNHLDIVGGDHVPAHGGVIVAVNHPGMTDTLVCFSSIARPDLRIISSDRPFVRALDQVSRRLFFVPDQPDERLSMVRQVSRFVQQGGAVMIFPSGRIEPDPAVMPGARESLATWSESLGLFARLAPQAVVVPAVVSGVVYGPAVRHPLTHLRRSARDRERVAATLQVVWQTMGRTARTMRVRIEFGAPLPAADLIPLGDAGRITRAVTAAVGTLLDRAANPTASSRPDRAYPSSQRIDLKEEA